MVKWIHDQLNNNQKCCGFTLRGESWCSTTVALSHDNPHIMISNIKKKHMLLYKMGKNYLESIGLQLIHIIHNIHRVDIQKYVM